MSLIKVTVSMPTAREMYSLTITMKGPQARGKEVDENSCLIESIGFKDRAYRSMALVMKEILCGVLNFDGVRTCDVHEQILR
jgi:hypothetical protein